MTQRPLPRLFVDLRALRGVPEPNEGCPILAFCARVGGQLDRGEGIPEDRLDAYLADLKAKSE